MAMLDPAAPYVAEMSFAEMEAVCTEAHRLGLHVAAHTAGGPPIEEALAAGVDTIEHGHWLTDRAIALMLERDASYVPTLIVNSRNFAYSREELGVSERSWRWLQAVYDAKWGSLERAPYSEVLALVSDGLEQKPRPAGAQLPRVGALRSGLARQRRVVAGADDPQSIRSVPEDA